MGMFLCESRHGIHVSSCVIMQYFKWVCHAFQRAVGAVAYPKFMYFLTCVGVRFTLERVVFTRHRMHLFLDPRV